MEILLIEFCKKIRNTLGSRAALIWVKSFRSRSRFCVLVGGIDVKQGPRVGLVLPFLIGRVAAASEEWTECYFI